jgi:SAM-dependent methyltransferase
VTDSVPTRPDYGLDAPGVVRGLALGGAAVLVFGVASSLLLQSSSPALAISLFNMGLWPGLSLLGTAALMWYGSRFGKLRERDRLLDALPWRGDEVVLDAGCGHGLLLIGAARRVPRGRAVGVDLWQSADQAGNRPEATLANARLEGVADRVEILDGDVRQLPFADNTFDVVVSSWCLHNIYDAAGRDGAVREIARVLKPGGRVAVVDIRHTAQYVQVLRDSGWSDVTRSAPRLLFLTPTFTVTGTKPGP